MPAANQAVIDAYQASAPAMIEQFDQISSETIFEHLLPYIDKPAKGALLDIGAGTGRDAAWFDTLGYDVTAVEPVIEFRKTAIKKYADRKIVWIDDRLPALATIRDQNIKFDTILLTAVWHHLTEHERRSALRRMASLSKRGGLMIMSLRHGPTTIPERAAYSIDVDETITLADRNGFKLLVKEERPSHQSQNRELGVYWTWLVFRNLG